MSNEERLDEILVAFFNEAEPDVHATNGETVYTKAGTHAKQAIKQLMANEFEKLIGEDEPNRQLLALRNELRIEQRQKLNQLFNKENTNE